MSMRVSDAKIGRLVRSTVDFANVPKGTQGVIDEHYDGGVMVAWDLPKKQLPRCYCRYRDGVTVLPRGVLRDGFSFQELCFLELADPAVVR